MKQRVAVALLLLPLLLTGCAAVSYGLRKAGLEPKRVTTVGARVPLNNGQTATFYHFKQGSECGAGVTYPGGGGEGTLSCGRMGLLTVGFIGNSDLAAFYGRVNDPAVARVDLTFADGQTHQAIVGNGLWYLMLPGQGPRPDLRQIQARDASGQIIYSSAP